MGNSHSSRKRHQQATSTEEAVAAIAVEDALRFPFMDLPDDMRHAVSTFFCDRARHNFARTNKELSMLVSEDLKNKKLTAPFVDFCAQGMQDEAKNYLEGLSKQDLQTVLTTKVTVTDPAGRRFKNITGFQYALWAYDRHMWAMIKPYFEKAFGVDWKSQAYAELQELETKGTEHGTHYDWLPLVSAYSDLLEEMTRDEPNLNSIGELLLKVGAEQKRVVVHIANEYCRSDRCFDRHATFDEKELPRNTDLYSYIKGEFIKWFSEVGFGDSFLALRGEDSFCGVRGPNASVLLTIGHLIQQDDAAHTNLYQVRSAELIALKQELAATPSADCRNQPGYG